VFLVCAAPAAQMVELLLGVRRDPPVARDLGGPVRGDEVL
jgi:hypothetical protein